VSTALPVSATVSGLVRASHPVPCLAITAMTVALAAAGGPVGWRAVPFAASVLAGQLSIGWSNDWADAELDRASGRTDKPVAAGQVSLRAVAIAAVVSVVVSFGLAFALGWTTGLISIPVVAAGWAYNLGLKSTVASGLMYLLGFGPIPALAASVLPGHPPPRAWTVIAAGLLGLGAHFANVLPDLAGDRAGGVRGLPQRVAEVAGERAVRVISLALLLGASALIALAPGVPDLALIGLGAALVLGLIGVRAAGRTPFRCAMGIAAINVVMFLFGGAALI
jgi:4-hydroxybenzoate polyprenyltransferase